MFKFIKDLFSSSKDIMGEAGNVVKKAADVAGDLKDVVVVQVKWQEK